jgi:hypothetical protein
MVNLNNVSKNIFIRLKGFGISEFDTCISCFEKKAIKHPILECSCIQEVWGHLGAKYMTKRNTKSIPVKNKI